MRYLRVAATKARLSQWGALFTLAFVLVAGRLAYVQVVRHGYFEGLAERNQWRDEEIPPPRGAIYDRNGALLATVGELHTIFADPELIPDPQAAAARLAPLLDTDRARLTAQLARDSRFVVLKRFVPADEARQFLALKLPGVRALPVQARVYPNGRLASHLLGKVDWRQRGISGVERALDDLLTGTPGRIQGEVDARRRPIPGMARTTEAAIPGGTVALTIDAVLQGIVEEELRAKVEATHARGGMAVMLDPRTGDILALSCLPDFDPNRLAGAPPEVMTNQVVSNTFEPGSTFKLVTITAALLEGMSLDTPITTCHAEAMVGGRRVQCRPVANKGGHGRITLRTMIIESCNIAAAQLAVKLGRERMWHAARLLGFGESTHSGLPSESGGQLAEWKKWIPVRTANAGFGQGVAVTALQMVRAYSTVANGGLLVQPRILHHATRPDGTTLDGVTDAQRVLPAGVAEQLRKVFTAVVSEGTGHAAKMEGILVGGKTGTAQKLDANGNYSRTAVRASFIGFVPADDPQLAMIVVIDEPRGPQYGGEVAAPVFKAIAQRALLYLGVSPSADAFAVRQRTADTSPAPR